MKRSMLLAILFGLTFGMMAPAQADISVAGHRCIGTDPDHDDNENTVDALRRVAAIRDGAIDLGCEIDAWLLRGTRAANGKPVIFHDEYWEGVADPDTLDGVPARVNDTTYEQSRQIRTTGGERIPLYRRMVDAAANRNLDFLMVEWKGDLSSRARGMVAYAERRGVRVMFYGILGYHDCSWRNVNAFRKAGAPVGIKSYHCSPTPGAAKRHGVDFVSLRWPHLKRETVRKWSRRGIDVWSGGIPLSDLDKAKRWGIDGTVPANPGKYVRYMKRAS